jgi:hypothetical protein
VPALADICKAGSHCLLLLGESNTTRTSFCLLLASYGHENVVLLVLENGTDVNTRSNHFTLLATVDTMLVFLHCWETQGHNSSKQPLL